MHGEPRRLQQLFASGELEQRCHAATSLLQHCTLCPRRCGVDRLAGQRGACRIAEHALVSSAGPHHGEERPLSGWKGSGTVFLSGCNLHCVFCQNWEISQRCDGREVTSAQLSGLFLDLQRVGCHNLNLVTPSHVVAQILAALLLACEQGFELPVVYNCGGYESIETLTLLDGVVDIYMPDVKFSDSQVARPYLGVDDYAEVSRAALLEMHRQVGDLQLSKAGIAQRGLLVRHLVLPDALAGTTELVEFVAREVSPNTYLNLMDQYRPCYRAEDYPPLGHRPSRQQLKQAREQACRLGLRLD